MSPKCSNTPKSKNIAGGKNVLIPSSKYPRRPKCPNTPKSKKNIPWGKNVLIPPCCILLLTIPNMSNPMVIFTFSVLDLFFSKFCPKTFGILMLSDSLPQQLTCRELKPLAFLVLFLFSSFHLQNLLLYFFTFQMCF